MLLKAIKFAVLICALFLMHSAASYGQGLPPQQDRPIDSATKDLVIEKLLEGLNQSYVFPDTAQRMTTDIRARQQRGEYDSITSFVIFKETINPRRAVRRPKNRSEMPNANSELRITTIIDRQSNWVHVLK